MSETALSASIRGALEASGFWVIRQQSKGRTGRRSLGAGEPGIPDLMLLGPGRGFLEVKTARGSVSQEQADWHKRAASHGERVAVVRSVRDAMTVALQWRHDDERNRT
jgi:hypothetical protein